MISIKKFFFIFGGLERKPELNDEKNKTFEDEKMPEKPLNKNSWNKLNIDLMKHNKQNKSTLIILNDNLAEDKEKNS